MFVAGKRGRGAYAFAGIDASRIALPFQRAVHGVEEVGFGDHLAVRKGGEEHGFGETLGIFSRSFLVHHIHDQMKYENVINAVVVILFLLRIVVLVGEQMISCLISQEGYKEARKDMFRYTTGLPFQIVQTS